MPAILLATACAFMAKIAVGLPEPPIPVPDNNRVPSEIKQRIGRYLMFDGILSVNGTSNCMDCHDPNHGFSDKRPVAEGRLSVNGTRPKGNRHPISLLEALFHLVMFHDGLEVGGLEAQVWDAILNPIEMGPQTIRAVCERLLGNGEYVKLFIDAGFDITPNPNRDRQIDDHNVAVMTEAIPACIAQAERTLVVHDTNYWHAVAGESWYESAEEKHGQQLFFGYFNCGACHQGHDLTDDKFHNIGLEFRTRNGDLTNADLLAGGAVAGLRVANQADNRKARTARLIDCVATAPYGSNGTLPDLPTAADFAIAGGYFHRGGATVTFEEVQTAFHNHKLIVPDDWVRDPNIDPEVRVIECTRQDRSDVIKFMAVSLTPRDYPKFEKPKLPR